MKKRFGSFVLTIIMICSVLAMPGMNVSAATTRATYNDVFASVKGSGYNLSQAKSYASTSYTVGQFVYVWGYLHDTNNNLYKSYGSGTCNMTLAIYKPDGTCAFSCTYNNSDNNWIGCKLDKAGTWKIQSKITGALSGNNTQTITVKDIAGSPSSPSSALSLSGATQPGTINQGAGFACKGKISSNYKITQVTVGIWNASGGVVSSYTVYPNSYSYDISKIDSYIHFSYAKSGTNYYKIFAKDEKKSSWLLNKSFTVKSNGTPIPVSKKITVFNQTSYANTSYGQDDKGNEATLSSGGCGVFALVNAVYYLNNKKIDPKSLAKYALTTQDPSGIKDIVTKKKRMLRYSGGTSDNLTKVYCNSNGGSYGIKYIKSVKNLSAAKSYIQSGCVAVIHVQGHFMALVNYNPKTEQYLVIDSFPSKGRGTSQDGYRWMKASEFTGKMALQYTTTSTPIHIIGKR